MKYIYPFTAIFNNGSTILVTNLEELKSLIDDYGMFGYEWVETEYTRQFRYKPFCETLPYDYTSTLFKSKRFQWIVRDDFGQKVDPNLIDFGYSRYYAWWYHGKRENQKLAAEKGLPIPYIRSRYKFRKHYKKTGGKRARLLQHQLKSEFTKNQNKDCC